ncbi:EAL domain-containing protein [Pseudovibrio exalbescens]|uniref:Diguanylate phosphodiesterase n=1 Tax=Pseudovibrio exalbescens TaxID=197461 RepID=A0A1U7JCJ0_9HYPH|nr:EAL domain-containing protein [Pseudovibrio exalbescens]OKL42459.1 diguanylate phosphodiesterase [Pseudovibrio exalbescens]
MSRAATLFIFACMTIVAISCGLVMMVQFQRPFGEAASVALALMCTMMVIHLVMTRTQEKSEFSESVERLEDRLSEIDDDVVNLEGRMSGMETNLPQRTRQEIDPVFAEVEVIGSLVKQMAEAMADMETRLDDQSAKTIALTHSVNAQQALPSSQGQIPASNQAAVGYTPDHNPSDAMGTMRHPHASHNVTSPEPEVTTQPQAAPRRPDPRMPRPDAALAAEISAALDAGRVDLYLQPIVTLPQRRVRYYEALSRLRRLDGETLEPVEFIAEAERTGQMPAIDNLLLFRSLQILKRLSSRNREAGLFCNLSPSTLVDEDFFPGFLEFVRANETYADLLIFEFTQAHVAAMGLLEHESLAALADLGFRFSVDQITDLRMDFRGLADKGFRFAKLNAARLLQQDETLAHGNIHPADFGSLLQRYGIELISDHVEAETQVTELLDLDIRCAQGYLFSPPRPVRADILQGAPNPRPIKRAQAG